MPNNYSGGRVMSNILRKNKGTEKVNRRKRGYKRKKVKCIYKKEKKQEESIQMLKHKEEI